jgi:hypothetical protein
MGLIPIILLAVVVIGFLAWKSHQRTVETWRRVGAELGLNTTVGRGLSRPVLSGAIAGLPVTVDTYTQRSGKNNTTYTRYRVGYPPLGIGLQLKREGVFSSVTKLFGFQDVAVGDAAFDDNFNVKTNNEAKLRNLLTPSVRSGLLQFTASYPHGAIKDAHIEVTTSRFESKADRLRSTVQRMVATARLLASPTAGVTDDMVSDREQGLVDEVAGRVRDLVEAEPEDVDQRIFEVETLAAAGDDAAAAERLRELERLAPADPDVMGWRRTLESKPSSSSPAETVDVNELAQNLFGGSDLSFETRSKFNAHYADASVRWEGRVKGVSETAKGWQAVITVAIVSNDLYGNTDIDVVVENPAGPRPSEGQTVVISGKLTRIDPLMRNLFITEGSLS